MEASLSGWFCVTSTAWLAPKMTTLVVANRMNSGSATLRFDLARSMWRFLSRYQELTLSIRAAPTVHDAMNTCMILGMNDGVKTTPQKLVITARVGAGSVAI